MTVEILAIIYVFSTFILLLTGLPVGFVLSGSALLFSLIGHLLAYLTRHIFWRYPIEYLE
ncbi:MAG: hypothetical protein Ct9H90mP18_02050 [Gammaproteobacteria bacterium]|nr:MAG: hypothetical protein Ct9H90mP18_02050 [Gammaproteobacteria bacterium]